MTLNLNTPEYKDHPHIKLIREIVTTMTTGVDHTLGIESYARLKRLCNDYNRRAIENGIVLSPTDRHEVRILDEVCQWVLGRHRLS